MLNKNVKKISWTLWGIFVLFAVLILVFNFIFQMLVKDADKKLTLAMNSVFIILNVIALSFLLAFLVFNISGHKIVLTNPDNVFLWFGLILYIFFAISSSIVLLNDDLYNWKAIMTMFSFISGLILFPLIVIKLINLDQNKNKAFAYAMIIFVILYLLINLLLNFIIFLNITDVIALLVTVTTLNLIISVVFFALVTKKVCDLNQPVMMENR